MLSRTDVLSGRRVGVVGKGGAGKSTSVVLLASALRRQGYTVCVLDADSTNLGLNSALGIFTTPRPLLDYFGGMVFSGGAVTCPVDDPAPLRRAEIDLKTIAPEYCPRNADGIFLLTAGKIADAGPGAGCDGPIGKIVRDVKLRVGDIAPVTLIDFKAGFEDAARGIVTSLDWLVTVVDPTEPAIRMATSMKAMVHRIKAGERPATTHLGSPELVDMANQMFRETTITDVLAVLNRIRDRETHDYLRAQLSHQGMQVIGTIAEDPAIAIAWLVGAPLPAGLQERADDIVAALETAESGYAQRPEEPIAHR
ncbi:MAG: P-loop NTPase [Gemmatimonadales bacterium]|jgi:CO dehydrogenase nickel-insertion accessory protein CooC1